MVEQNPNQLVVMADRYLDIHQHSVDAYEHVRGVLGAFEFMVDLAMGRAMEKLETDDIVLQFPK